MRRGSINICTSSGFSYEIHDRIHSFPGLATTIIISFRFKLVPHMMKALQQSTLRNLIVGTLALVLVTSSLTAQESKFALPASEEGLPGEGMLRRYDG